MGLRSSISRRWTLAKGLPPRKRFEVFFARKKTRTALWVDKKDLAEKNREKTRIVSLAQKHINLEWYATLHGLDKTDDVVRHFLDKGLSKGFAPSEEFADENGNLLTWGVEYFARLGFPVGERSSGDLPPEDPDAIFPFSIKNVQKKPLAVVSANFGDFDRLMPIDSKWSKSTDFFIFTDRKFENSGEWQLTHANYFHVDPRRRARFIKTHLPTYFGAYERVLWIDGNVLLCQDPVKILREYGVWKRDFATYRHWQRSGLVAEAAACVQLGKDEPQIIGSHLATISKHPAFERRGVYSTMVMMVNPRAEMAKRMSADWWTFIMRGSKRDQLSLPLAVDNAVGLDSDVFPEESIEMSPFFVRLKH